MQVTADVTVSTSQAKDA